MQPETEPGTVQEVPGEGRDVRDSTGAGDAEFLQERWREYDEDNAIVDVDVRGWIYTPHTGQMSRKQRLFIGLARKLVGIEVPTTGANARSSSSSQLSSRDPSPGQISDGQLNEAERQAVQQAQKDDILTAKEAEEILRRGEKEAEVAANGKYSEKPTKDDDDSPSLSKKRSLDSIRTIELGAALAPSQKRDTWSQPSDMTAAELAEANARLMARLRHFLAIPAANTPVSIFFYNDKDSKQRTVYTNSSGHFSISAPLDFVPTHVRILASEKLSATEEVTVTEAHGVSVISDIDDTIKHSAISSGAREIFRNAFIRDLGDLTIEGVREWYNRMAELGARFHYVSNSPWQLYPVISKYFAMAGLPPGSFHLKQYSGMMQGIFEPVAERKKGTLDKIARDFPERRFILVGDSGEADLEVYTDFVLENPGRVIAVFIRDVTTPEGGGFFDPSVGPMPTGGSSTPRSGGGSNTPSRASAGSAQAMANEENDPELKAAIQASLRELDEEEKRRSRSIFPTVNELPPQRRPQLPPRRTSLPQETPNLIDLESSSDEEGPEVPLSFHRTNSDKLAQRDSRRASAVSTRSGPPLPKKPEALRSPSSDSNTSAASGPPSLSANTRGLPIPPKLRRPSNQVTNPSPLSQEQGSQPQTQPRTHQPGSSTPARRPVPQSQSQSQSQVQQQSEQTYTGMALSGLSTVYNHLPTLRSETPAQSPASSPAARKAPPPPPPPRRGVGAVTAYPAAAASFVGAKAVSAWQAAPSVNVHVPHPNLPLLPGSGSRPGLQSAHSAAPYSTSNSSNSNSLTPLRPGDRSDRAGLQRSQTGSGSTLGLSGPTRIGGGGAGGDGEYPPGMNKREVLWRQRWARAEAVLGERGVKLMSWRVGKDVVGEAERVIRRAVEGEKSEQRERR